MIKENDKKQNGDKENNKSWKSPYKKKRALVNLFLMKKEKRRKYHLLFVSRSAGCRSYKRKVKRTLVNILKWNKQKK